MYLAVFIAGIVTALVFARYGLGWYTKAEAFAMAELAKAEAAARASFTKTVDGVKAKL